MLAPLIAFSAVTIGSLAVAARRLQRRDWNVLDPTITFWLGFALYYGFGNVWYCWKVQSQGAFDQGGFSFDPTSASDMAALAQVSGLTVAYGLSVLLGMFWLGRSLLPSGFLGAGVRRLAGGPDLAVPMLVPLCVIHWLTQLGAIPRPDVLLPSGVLIIPMICCQALNVRLSYEATRRPTGRAATVAVGVLVLSAICGAVTGMKEAILMPAVASFGGLMLGVRRPWPIVAAIVAALPAFLVLQIFNHRSRVVLWDSTTSLSLIERVDAVGSAGGSVLADDQDDAAQTDFGRLCTAVPMMQTLELLNRDDGISIVDGLVVPYIPRVLWPSKPAVVVGGVLYEKFSGQVGSSSSPCQPAEAFMYGGWPGVAVLGLGMGLLAAVGGALVQHLWNARKAASLGVVIVMAINFGKCENWLWAYLPSVLNCSVVLIVLQSLNRWLITSRPWLEAQFPSTVIRQTTPASSRMRS